MVNIRYNSLHAKLYRWFFQTRNMPGSLCPYFWGNLVALFIAPLLFIAEIPGYLLARVGGNQEYFRLESHMTRLGVSVMAFLCGFVLWVMGKALLYIMGYLALEGNEPGIIFGIALWIIAIAVSSVFGIMYFSQRELKALEHEYNQGKFNYCEYRERKEAIRSKRLVNRIRIPKPGKWLVVVAIKAWYHRNCPVVQWK